MRVEVVETRQRRAYLPFAGLVLGDRAGRHQQVIQRVRKRRGLIGKILQHHAERNVNLVDVEAVITGVLFLVLHRADDGEGIVGDVKRLADGGPGGEKLLFGLAAEEGHAALLAEVVPIVKAPLGHADAPDLCEGGKRTRDDE